MQPILLKKDDILKGGEGYVQLLSDVEALSLGNKELGKIGGNKRWAGKTEEERKAIGSKLLEARQRRKAQPDPALLKAFNALIPKVETPIEGLDLSKKTPKSVDAGSAATDTDWSLPPFRLAQLLGVSMTKAMELKEKALKNTP